MNDDDRAEIAFNERCQMRTIETVKNDDAPFDGLSLIALYADKELKIANTLFLTKKISKSWHVRTSLDDKLEAAIEGLGRS